MVIAADNYQFLVRRKRLGFTQRQIARMLPHQCAVSAISDFERGEEDSLPHGQTRDDYDALLTRLEAEKRAS